MRVRYTPRAIEDLQDIFAYIEKENPFAASRIIDGIRSVVAELGDIPGMGSPTDKQGIQRFPVSGTPYLIFYEILEGEVAIFVMARGGLGLGRAEAALTPRLLCAPMLPPWSPARACAPS